jgi:ribosomal protein L12E/L44/L45/RPP1/RPP2
MVNVGDLKVKLEIDTTDIEKLVAAVDAAVEALDAHIVQYFEYSHLPEALKKVSAPFGALAADIVATLPANPERTVALRKLLEAKDAAVRARIAK